MQALQYRIWNLGPSSKKLHKGNIWDFGTKLGLFWDHFYTLLGLLVVIFIKMPQNLQKGFKNRVVTTFNAKLTLFGDHFSVMFPVLYQPCTTNLEPPEPLMASYVRFMAFWGCFWPFWGSLMAIWDLHAKLGLFWDQIWTLVPFGTKSQIWDFIEAPVFHVPSFNYLENKFGQQKLSQNLGIRQGCREKKTGKFGLLPLVFFSFGTLPLLQFVPEAFSTILNDQKHLYKNLLHKFIKRGEGGQRPFINFINKLTKLGRCDR